MALWLVVPGDWRRPSDLDTYPLRWCHSCCFGQVHPRPAKEHIPSFYAVESYYTHNDDSADSGHPRTIPERLRNRIAYKNDHGIELNDSFLRGLLNPGARVLDLGCGNGGRLAEIGLLGYEVAGIEPDPVARQVAREKGLRVLPGTAEDLPDEIRDERFHCIIMSHVLEHCLDPIRATSNAASLLADGGALIIETPNNEARGLKTSGVLWPWLDVPRHLNFFTGKSLRSLCEGTDLRVKTVDYLGYTRQFSPEWIAMERTVYANFAARARPSIELPALDRESHAWRLLFSTLMMPKRLKYDSVCVIAERPTEGYGAQGPAQS